MYTFLFSDIEGSTRLLQQLGDSAPAVMARHHEILRAAIGGNGGTVQRTAGDSFFATFDAPADALAAAVAAQQRLAAEPWPDRVAVRVRMGLHTGDVVDTGDELFGLDVHRAARIMSAGWGGQILVSAVTSEHLRPAGVRLRDLGVHRLKDLAEPEHLHQVVVDGLRSDFPALRTLDATPNNLPTQLTTFVGRERELAEIVDLLASTRVLTLTGPGGTGKTRLCLQTAAEVSERFPDGTFFVPLANVTDPGLVMASVASVLGLVSAGSQPPLELVTDHLQERQVLLVLDNFEQVLPAAVEVSKLLASAPAVTVLLTSRAPLHISGEQEYPVQPLGLPAPVTASLDDVAASEAGSLFLARAVSIRPGFRLSPDNAADVATIIRRLDGLPLAIELAASQVRILPVHAIAARLGHVLDLSSGARDLPDRQRTLRGAILWSYDLVDEPSRTLFARMSVFRGGAELEQVERVCGPGLDADVFECLTTLVEHSLLHRAHDPESARFGMIETIREFSSECLGRRGEREELRRRHAEEFLELVRTAEPHLTGPESGSWLDRLERDHDNLRAALRRAVGQGWTRIALQLVSSLWRLWHLRGHLYEGRRHVAAAVALPDARDHAVELAAAWEAGGGVAYWQADLATSRTYYERSLELYRSLGDEVAIARALYNYAFAHGLGDPHSALDVFRRALGAYERLGDEMGVAKAHWGMAVGAFWARDYPLLVDQLDECIPVFRAARRTFDLAWSLHMKGLGELAFGSHDAARALFEECLEMFLDADDASGYYLALADFALLAEARGEAERALRLFGAVERIGDETGSRLLDPQMELLPRHRHAENAFDADTVAALRAEGRSMTREQAIAYARQR